MVVIPRAVGTTALAPGIHWKENVSFTRCISISRVNGLIFLAKYGHRNNRRRPNKRPK